MTNYFFKDIFIHKFTWWDRGNKFIIVIQRIGCNKTKMLNGTGNWATPEGTMLKVDKFKNIWANI